MANLLRVACFALLLVHASMALDPIPARVSALLAQMTLEEKVAELMAVHVDPPKSGDPLVKSSFGALKLLSHWLKGSPCERLKARNQFQELIMSQSRLRIPVSFILETLHQGAAGTTIFPMPITMGASWDPVLITKVYQNVARDAIAGGTTVGYGPVLNLYPDPRFGRFQESFSQDPCLVSHLGVAATVGMQGPPQGPDSASTYLPPNAIIAMAKHVAAYGGAEGGLNAAPALQNEGVLREMFLRPWKAFSAAGGRGAMAAHQTILGVPCHASRWLLTDVMRKEFGFGKGVVVSDCNDIEALTDYRIAANMSQAAARAVYAGVDWDLQCGKKAYTLENLQDAMNAGLVDQSVIDNATARVLTLKFAAGLFETPYVNDSACQDLDNAKDRALARQIAAEGIVNDGILPFKSTSSTKVAVIGPLGSNTNEAREAIIGAYTSDLPAGQSERVRVPSLVEALNSKNMDVSYSVGVPVEGNDTTGIHDAVKLAKASDLVVLALGDNLHTCGEWGDRSSLDLPGAQMDLLTAIAGDDLVRAKVVVVLIHGRTVTFGDNHLKGVNAILATGRPGEEGMEAVADIITGDTVPSGKLAASWPRSVGQVGSGSSSFLQSVRGKWVANTRGAVDADGRRYDNYVGDPQEPTPLFYFGHGLSYTTFAYSNLSVTVAPGAKTPVTVTVSVKNSGSVDGAEISQVYVTDPVGVTALVRPWKRLVGFARTTIPAGQTAQVAVRISADDLSVYDEHNSNFGVARGRRNSTDEVAVQSINSSQFSDLSDLEQVKPLHWLHEDEYLDRSMTDTVNGVLADFSEEDAHRQES